MPHAIEAFISFEPSVMSAALDSFHTAIISCLNIMPSLSTDLCSLTCHIRATCYQTVLKTTTVMEASLDYYCSEVGCVCFIYTHSCIQYYCKRVSFNRLWRLAIVALHFSYSFFLDIIHNLVPLPTEQCLRVHVFSSYRLMPLVSP